MYCYWPRIDLAIALIDRMKRLFVSSKDITAVFDTKETVIELNNVKIGASTVMKKCSSPIFSKL